MKRRYELSCILPIIHNLYIYYLCWTNPPNYVEIVRN
jgi:hypothetical protein